MPSIQRKGSTKHSGPATGTAAVQPTRPKCWQPLDTDNTLVYIPEPSLPQAAVGCPEELRAAPTVSAEMGEDPRRVSTAPIPTTD
jgi:hypothetical protein